MAIKLSIALRTKIVSNTFGGLGNLSVFDGVQPADPNTPAPETPLVVFSFSAMGASNGSVWLPEVVEGTPVIGGTATWARLAIGGMTGVGDEYVDGAVGTINGDFILSTLVMFAGATVKLTSIRFTMPES